MIIPRSLPQQATLDLEYVRNGGLSPLIIDIF